jgi:hypothetical protein
MNNKRGKFRKITVTIVVAILLVSVISGYYTSASAEGDTYGNLVVSNFRLWINNIQAPDSTSEDAASTAPKGKDGDAVRVAMDWNIVNNQTDEAGQKIYDFSYKLYTDGIVLQDESDKLYIDGTYIGTYELANSVLSIHLDADAVANRSNICGGVALDATLLLDEDDTLSDGSLQTVGVGDKTFNVIYDSGSANGSVSLNKSTDGDITYEDGVYYQNYKVTVTAKGKISDIVFTDTPSVEGGLTLDATSLSVTPSDDVIIDSDNFKITFPDNLSKKASKTYTVSYRMAVSDAVMKNYTKVGNTANVDYTDMSGTPKNTKKTVYITPEKPTISKTGSISMGDSANGENPYYEYMTWTISVDLGTREKELTEEEKNELIVEDVYEAPSLAGPPFTDMTYYDPTYTGNGYKQKIPLSAFTYDSKTGKYTYTYTTYTHFFSNYSALSGGSTIYTNTASTEPFGTHIESTAQIDSRSVVNPVDLMVKEPVSITYVDMNGEEHTKDVSGNGDGAATYGDAVVEWKLTIDFGKLPDLSVSGPTQWTSFVISDKLCDNSGVYNGLHKFNCTCTNGHNPGTCPECEYCSNKYMSFQVVDASGNKVDGWDINYLYTSGFQHNSVTINDDSWSMILFSESNSSAYNKFANYVNNGYKMIITYKTTADIETLTEEGNGVSSYLYNSATVEGGWCGVTIKQTGIQDGTGTYSKELTKYVGLNSTNPEAVPKLTYLSKAALNKAVTIGGNTYSYTHDNYIGWRVMMKTSELAAGDTLVVHDTPDKRLSYVDGSAIIYDSNSYDGTKGFNLFSNVKIKTNEDGSLDFDFGKISEEMLSSYPYIVIYYQTKVDEDVWYAQYTTGKSTSYTNKAQAICSNTDEKPTSVAMYSMAPPTVVKKSGILKQDNEKQIIAAEYTININNNGSDLASGAETLQAVDTMAKTMVLNKNSVEVYKDSVSEDNRITDYTVDYDKADNTLTFTIPNKTHIIITYSVTLDVDPIDDPLWYMDTNNTVQVEGFTLNENDSTVSLASYAMNVKVWAYDTNGDITIYKYWNNGGTKTALPGATFRLYSVYDNNGHTYTETDEDYIIRDNIKITDDSGEITIKDLPLDRIYRLEEVSAPEGYTKGKDYYFVLQGHYGVTIPDELADKDITEYRSGDIIEFENKAYITITGTKTWVNDSAELRPDSIQLVLYANDEAVEDKYEVVWKDTDTSEWHYTIDKLPKYDDNGKLITYTIEETPVKNYETDIDGYDITNTYVSDTIDITGTKVWEDEDNKDGIRPDSITIYLYADGKKIDEQVVTGEVSDSENTEDEEAAETTEGEVSDTPSDSTEGTSADTSPDAINGTNDTQPDAANGTADTQPDTTAGADADTQPDVTEGTTADTQPDVEAGTNVDTQPDAAEGTTADIQPDAVTDDNSDEVKNSLADTSVVTPAGENLDISDTDAATTEGLSDNAGLVIEANGAIAVNTSNDISDSNTWTWSFTDLPIYVNGKKVEYTIVEEKVEGYSADIEEVSAYKYVITNTHKSEEITETTTEDITTEKSTTEKATTEKATTEKTTTEKTTTERVTTEEVTEEKTTTETEVTETETTEEITSEVTTGEATTDEQTTGEATTERVTTTISTGDDTPIIPIVILLFASTVGVIALTVAKDKNKKSE